MTTQISRISRRFPMRSTAAAAFVLSLSACVGTPGGGNTVIDTGSGFSSNGAAATGTVSARPDGAFVVSINESGFSCTSVFNEVGTPNGRSTSNLLCTDGNNGTAVLRYNDVSAPRAVAYFRGTAGSGSINF